MIYYDMITLKLKLVQLKKLTVVLSDNCCCSREINLISLLSSVHTLKVNGDLEFSTFFSHI